MTKSTALSNTHISTGRFAYTGSPFAGVPWAIVGCGLTATSFLFAKLLGQHSGYSAIEINLYRSIIVFLILLIYAIIYKKQLVSPNIKEHIIRAITGWSGAILQTFALNSLIPMPTIQMLSYTNPIFFVLILAIWYKERIIEKVWIGVILGFIGAGILLRPSGIKESSDMIYLLAALSSGFLTALTYLNIQKLSQVREPAWRIVFYYSIISIIFSGIWIMVSGQPFKGIHTMLDTQWIAGLGLFILFGQLCYTQAYLQGNTSITAIFSYSHLLYASLFSVWIFRQSLDVVSWIGIAIIVLGGLITRGAKRA